MKILQRDCLTNFLCWKSMMKLNGPRGDHSQRVLNSTNIATVLTAFVNPTSVNSKIEKSRVYIYFAPTADDRAAGYRPYVKSYARGRRRILSVTLFNPLKTWYLIVRRVS